jgi:hypothetical protein
MAVEDAYELAYREAVRALDHQRAEATALQSRAGMLLATASISISLLGRDAFDAFYALAWLGVLCFALLSVCVLAIVWPHTDQGFNMNPQALLAARLAGSPPDATALSVQLIGLIALHHRANGRRLARMSRAFHIGACVLAIQLMLTVLAATVTV